MNQVNEVQHTIPQIFINKLNKITVMLVRSAVHITKNLVVCFISLLFRKWFVYNSVGILLVHCSNLLAHVQVYNVPFNRVSVASISKYNTQWNSFKTIDCHLGDRHGINVFVRKGLLTFEMFCNMYIMLGLSVSNTLIYM